MLNYSTSEENYIKTIYHLQNGQNTVTTNALAEKLSTQTGFCHGYDEETKNKKIASLSALPGLPAKQ